MIVSPVNQRGISSVTGTQVRGTLPVFVRVIVYSKTSPIILSPPFISTTLIPSSRSERAKTNDVERIDEL
jgi:hypothetical protein